MTRLPTGRPTWAMVDLNALRWNFKQVQRLVGRQVGILSVVKANAYGHGAVAVARELVASGVNYLGVATVTEGEELRRAGVRVPLVVFGLIQPGEADEVVRLGLEPTVITRTQARSLAQAAAKQKKRVRIHIKVDTGMGRIGLFPHEVAAFVRYVGRLPGLVSQGLYTHFAHADGNDPRLLKRQMAQLGEALAAARAAGWHPAIVHAANSAAVMESPETHCDLVRPGLMLYGAYPAPRFKKKVNLKPVLSWRTRIVYVKSVPASTGLSYGHTFITRRLSRIATLPVGYADGFSRAFSNHGEVLIRGRSCPVVGRVCMDMCLVDVTGIPGVAIGDEVVLLGRQGDRAVTADDLGMRIGTISYEIFCSIGSRVPRIFIGGTHET